MSDPNRAPLNDTAEPRDESTAAQQLADDDTPRAGGGGLGGLSAAEVAAAAPPQEGATPSNPASPAVAGDAASLHAQDEARHLSEDSTAEPKPLPGQ